MKSLIEVLDHPFLIQNRIAEDLYEDTGAIYFERLRSRIKGRHRFTLAEYKDLRKLLSAFAGKIHRLPPRLDRAWANQHDGPWVYRLMDHPWVNRKSILLEVGKRENLTYYQVYDQIRGRTVFKQNIYDRLVEVYEEYAPWLDEKLEEMKEERKTYLFSHGRGGRGHIKRLESLPPNQR
jgi:hypothetical protein